MEKWGRKNKKNFQIAISQKGIEKALEKGKEDYDRRRFDLEVCVFSHMVAGIISGKRDQIPFPPVSIKWLFELLDTRTYRSLFNKSLRKCSTDEVPSDFMRDLYRKFKKWQAKGGATTTHKSTITLENRYELGEYKQESWMGNLDQD